MICIIISFLLLAAFGLYINKKNVRQLALLRKTLKTFTLDDTIRQNSLLAMEKLVDRQQEEKQLIIHNLHDNLGSMLAALRLTFENLQLRSGNLSAENPLLERTHGLLNESYHKVHGLANGLNTGLYPENGLLPAAYEFLRKMETTSGIKIYFIHFGFYGRMDNSTEIMLFRIIRELASNIIKHSSATEATISLTHHEHNINILAEDNGIGFNPEAVKPKSGLYTLKQLAESRKGIFTIDTAYKKGTNIIIDLPI